MRGQAMEEVIDDLNQRFQKLVDKGREWIEDEDIQEKIKHYKKQAGDTIKKYPVGSIAVGLLAGFLFARWISHRGDD